MEKKCIVIFVILVVGLSLASGAGVSPSGTGSASSAGTGNTPWQEGAIEGLKIGFHMGQMYALANQGQNISGFNAEVDNYNAWVQKNFGNNMNLLMSKLITASGAPITVPSTSAIPPNFAGEFVQRKPFNASSDLGKFGKQQILTEFQPRSEKYAEAQAADWILRNF